MLLFTPVSTICLNALPACEDLEKHRLRLGTACPSVLPRNQIPCSATGPPPTCSQGPQSQCTARSFLAGANSLISFPFTPPPICFQMVSENEHTDLEGSRLLALQARGAAGLHDSRPQTDIYQLRVSSTYKGFYLKISSTMFKNQFSS